MPEVLRFGITSLDELFGEPTDKPRADIAAGIYLPDPTARGYDPTIKNPSAGDSHEGLPEVFTTSVCIIGPTGTGKSIFALHVASTYLSDCIVEKSLNPKAKLGIPTVLYISTDLTYKMAERAWSNFALNYPKTRIDPFYPKNTGEKSKPVDEILLKKCDPTSLAQDFDVVKNEEGHVLFLDMAAYTAGDDWGFLHRVLSLLPIPEGGAGATPSPRHLVVIDAIEGFEALGGEVNAFGEKSTRRSRIAQMMRLVSGKCHAVLVVEQSRDTARHDTLGEEFVADTVIRLDSISTRNYERRVLKVEKCRGQSHIRGQHHYSIRSGKGSTTGLQVNPDDPKVRAPVIDKPAEPERPEDEFPSRKDRPSHVDRYKRGDADAPQSSTKPGDPEKDRQLSQSYVQVFHSVHRISRKIMEDEIKQTEDRPKPPLRYAAFGIKYLDNMLGGTDEITLSKEDEDHFWYDTRGLPCSLTTALIGDSLTQKSTLGRAFLSRCFFRFDKKLREIRDSLILAKAKDEPLRVDELWRYITRKVDLLSESKSKETKERESEIRGYLKTFAIPELFTALEELAGKHSIISEAAAPKMSSDVPHLLTNVAAWLADYRAGVAVMLVTHNTDFELLAEDFKRWLYSDPNFERSLNLPGYDYALTNYIKGGTICRRLEIHSLSSEVLVHIIRQAIYAAQRKIMTPLEMEGRAFRYTQSWPIRLVIDDFSSLRNIFPELREDPLLFPSILFHLEREGVTTLIIDTQAGKPETTIAERFETELRQMVHHRLYTWRVPFYGESRVAIAAIPPLSHEYAGIVRELRWETERLASDDHSEPATVDPHFELYSGLEEGKPEPVPLHVRFYSETPAMEEYIKIENEFLGEMFSPFRHPANQPSQAIILGMTPANYGELRSLAYLQRDTRLDYTFLFQVDEFWSMRAPGRHKRAGAFQPQWSYLNAITATATKSEPKREDYIPNPHADPYELFFLRNQDPEPEEKGKPALNLRRIHFYEKYYEDFDPPFDSGNKVPIDRVPFSWDFGFLLCQEKAWKDNTRLLAEWRKGDEITVQRVWRSLTKAENEDSQQTQSTATDEKPLEYVSWRNFAEACKKAAEEQSAILSKPVTAFDFAQVSPESFSCLIFEIWLSEVYDCLMLRKERVALEEKPAVEKELENLLNTVTKRQLFTPKNGKPREITLSKLLKDYWLEFYKSWLLLIEVLDLSKIIGDATLSTFDLRSANTDFLSVASRHWYKTATQCPDEIARKEPLIPVRLPGHFSVRGDWFLAVSGGSRSVRQAERALDLLNSRRANVTRLQMGVGLPTRVPKSKPKHGVLYTKLISHQGGQDSIEYDMFLKIAADRSKNFYWFWRSGLEDYSSYNRVWHRWLNRMLLWWHRKLLRYRWAWRNSFQLHDVLTNHPPQNETDFAPTREQLEEYQELKNAGSSDEKRKLQKEFFGRYPETHSIAQLMIRVEFLELLEVLKEELQQVEPEI